MIIDNSDFPTARLNMTEYHLLPLHGKHGIGKFVKIDIDDKDRLLKYNWLFDKPARFYVRINGHKISMQRFVMNAVDGQIIHRVSDDLFDMRKSNLRVVSTCATDLVKFCSQCKQTKEINLFPKCKISPSGFTGPCLECGRIATNERRNMLSDRSDEELDQARANYRRDNPVKDCSSCGKTLPIDRFYIRRSSTSGYNNICDNCTCLQSSEHKEMLRNRSDEEIKQEQTKTEVVICSRCNETRSPSDFHTSRNTKTGLVQQCKKCRAETARELYEKNRAFIDSLKEGCCCDECGFDEPRCLDFAHYNREDKARTVSGKPIEPSSLPPHRLLEELELVRLLCRVCHAYETYDEQHELLSDSKNAVWYRKTLEPLYDFVNNEKLFRGSCIDCGFEVKGNNPFVFDFDHRPEEIKIDCVATMVRDRYPENEIFDEMDKCDLRCKNCHVLITWLRKQSK